MQNLLGRQQIVRDTYYRQNASWTNKNPVWDLSHLFQQTLWQIPEVGMCHQNFGRVARTIMIVMIMAIDNKMSTRPKRWKAEVPTRGYRTSRRLIPRGDMTTTWRTSPTLGTILLKIGASRPSTMRAFHRLEGTLETVMKKWVQLQFSWKWFRGKIGGLLWTGLAINPRRVTTWYSQWI